MSYSFTARAATRAAAKTEVATNLNAVVTGQPVHEKDRGPAQAVADAFIDALRDPAEGEQVVVSMHGSVWVEGGEYRQVSVGCDAKIVKTDA